MVVVLEGATFGGPAALCRVMCYDYKQFPLYRLAQRFCSSCSCYAYYTGRTEHTNQDAGHANQQYRVR